MLILLLLPLAFAMPAPSFEVYEAIEDVRVFPVFEENIQVLYDGETDGTYSVPVGTTFELTVELDSGIYFVKYGEDVQTLFCRLDCTRSVEFDAIYGETIIQVKENTDLSYSDTDIIIDGVIDFAIDTGIDITGSELDLDISIPNVTLEVPAPTFVHGALEFNEDEVVSTFMSCTDIMFDLSTDLPTESYAYTGLDLIVDYTFTEPAEYYINVTCGEPQALTLIINDVVETEDTDESEGSESEESEDTETEDTDESEGSESEESEDTETEDTEGEDSESEESEDTETEEAEGSEVDLSDEEDDLDDLENEFDDIIEMYEDGDIDCEEAQDNVYSLYQDVSDLRDDVDGYDLENDVMDVQEDMVEFMSETCEVVTTIVESETVTEPVFEYIEVEVPAQTVEPVLEPVSEVPNQPSPVESVYIYVLAAACGMLIAAIPLTVYSFIVYS